MTTPFRAVRTGLANLGQVLGMGPAQGQGHKEEAGSSYTGVGRDKGPFSEKVLQAVLYSQLTGRAGRSLRQLPKDVYRRLQSGSNGMATLCMDLDTHFRAGKVEECKTVLRSLSRQICELTSVHHQANREALVLFGGDTLLVRILCAPSPVDESTRPQSQSQSEEGSVRNLHFGDESQSGGVWLVRNECLGILRELCFTMPYFSESLAPDKELIIRLFGLFANHTTFDNAIGLAEEVLAVRQETMSLEDIPNFSELVTGFTSRQLAFFCRVLAMVVFEPEDRGAFGAPSKVEKLEVLEGVRILAGRTNADVNHTVLLAVPRVLQRLVELLTVRYLPFTAQVEHLLTTAAEAAGGEDIPEDWHEEPAEGQGVNIVVRQVVEGEEGRRQVTLGEALGRGAYHAPLQQWQVEVLFVLCALLAGREKVRVQDELAALGLVPALNELFDKLDWNAPVPRPPEPHGIHGPGCACNPESALKIQYLRLVHNFCDRDGNNSSNKRLLMEPLRLPSSSRPAPPTRRIRSSLASPHRLLLSEVSNQAQQQPPEAHSLAEDVLQHLMHLGEDAMVMPMILQPPTEEPSGLDRPRGADQASTSGVATPRERVSPPRVPAGGGPPQGRRRSGGDKEPVPKHLGLMGKIVWVLKREPPESVYRFWLASCIEAFLRGSDPRHQEYVVEAGLMDHLLEEILKGGFKCASSLQINFDLLGELIKFNPAVFARLNALLKGDKFDRLVEVMVSHLVDSNVFIRSIMLSLECFRTGNPSPSYAGPSPPPTSEHPPHTVLPPPLSPAAARLSTGEPSGGSSLGAGGYFAAYERREGKFDAGECQLTAFTDCNVLRLLRDLMCAVSRDEVNQDNICVLNTALIFFIFAERNGQLANYLAVLRGAECGSGSGPGSVTRNFRTLLDYWRAYYSRKRGRDSLSLEYSTNVPFADWLRIADILCGGPESPTSLSYSPASQCAALTASTELPPRRS